MIALQKKLVCLCGHSITRKLASRFSYHLEPPAGSERAFCAASAPIWHFAYSYVKMMEWPCFIIRLMTRRVCDEHLLLEADFLSPARLLLPVGLEYGDILILIFILIIVFSITSACTTTGTCSHCCCAIWRCVGVADKLGVLFREAGGNRPFPQGAVVLVVLIREEEGRL